MLALLVGMFGQKRELIRPKDGSLFNRHREHIDTEDKVAKGNRIINFFIVYPMKYLQKTFLRQE